MIRIGALWRGLRPPPSAPYVPTMASQQIEALTQALARLPGFGPRSARRAVLHLMKKREAALEPLLAALKTVSETLSTCSVCGNVDTSDPCSICREPRRDEKSLCVVEEVADLWALDRSRLFPGRYHVLGGRLSALEGVRPEDLSIDKLVKRIAAGGIDEVVLPITSRSGWRNFPFASHSWRTAFLSAVNSTISTKGHWPRRSVPAVRSLEPLHMKD